MTDKQIEKLENELYFKYYGDKCRCKKNLKMEITPEDERAFEELRCRSMINSCLTYGDDPYEKHYKWWYAHGYCIRTYMSEYEETLGVARVAELVEEQRKTFATAIIHQNVYTDPEGLSYNSVEFLEE